MNLKSQLPLVAILCCTIFVFFPALQGAYLLGWDDDQQILNNQDVLNLSWDRIQNYFSTFYVRSYQPLASLSFGIEYALFGENAFVHHLTNLCLHLANICLVFYFVTKFLPIRAWLHYVIVLLFAIHPMQAELLGWISTRSTLLCSLFFLLSILSYVKYLQVKKNKIGWYSLAFLWFVCSLCSKTSAIVLPFVLIALDLNKNFKMTLRNWVDKTPYFAGSIVIGIVSVYSREVVNSTGDFSRYYTFYEKISIFCHALYLYIEKGFLASNLIVFYAFPLKLQSSSIPTSFLLSPIWILIAIVFSVYMYKRLENKNKSFFVFGLFFFILNIFLVLNITPFSETYFAERYAYLSLIGLFISVAILINQLLDRVVLLKNIAILLSIGYGLFMVYKANQRAHLWNNKQTLWSHVVASKVQHAYPYKMLGRYYADKGMHTNAIEIYNRGVKENPYNVDLYFWRGKSIAENGDLDFAKKDFNRVIQTDSKLVGQAYYEGSLIYQQLQVADTARIYLDSASVYNVKEAIFAKQVPNVNRLSKIANKYQREIDSLKLLNKPKETLKILQNLLLITPFNVTTYLEKAQIEMSIKQWDSALDTYNQGVKIAKKNGTLRLSRAYALSMLRRYDKAIDDYTFAIDSLDKREGEVFYFRAISYLNNKEKEKACKDLKVSKELGFEAAMSLHRSTCK